MTHIIDDVADYYSGKIRDHGATPGGVDWNSEESQRLRLDTLFGALGEDPSGDLLDYGCGYGAALPMLAERFPGLRYTGFDVSEEMVAAATVQHQDRGEFLRALPDGRQWGYTIASGIFNVRLGHADDEWLSYIHDTLDAIDSITTGAFAFNVLTSYSDADKQRPDLYYADPLALFDRCKRRYSRLVALLHDYPLYEFTIIVRKGANA